MVKLLQYLDRLMMWWIRKRLGNKFFKAHYQEVIYTVLYNEMLGQIRRQTGEPEPFEKGMLKSAAVRIAGRILDAVNTNT